MFLRRAARYVILFQIPRGRYCFWLPASVTIGLGFVRSVFVVREKGNKKHIWALTSRMQFIAISCPAACISRSTCPALAHIQKCIAATCALGMVAPCKKECLHLDILFDWAIEYLRHKHCGKCRQKASILFFSR